MEVQRNEADCEAANSTQTKCEIKHNELAAGDLLAEYSDEEQRKAVRKLDWNLITL